MSVLLSWRQMATRARHGFPRFCDTLEIAAFYCFINNGNTDADTSDVSTCRKYRYIVSRWIYRIVPYRLPQYRFLQYIVTSNFDYWRSIL